jgi:hypothetical protein
VSSFGEYNSAKVGALICRIMPGRPLAMPSCPALSVSGSRATRSRS